jgi:hypothetical protein
MEKHLYMGRVKGLDPDHGDAMNGRILEIPEI